MMVDFFGLTRSYREKTPLKKFLEETFPNDFEIYEEKIGQEWLIFYCIWKQIKGAIRINFKTGAIDEQSTTPIFLVKIKEQMRKNKNK